MVIREDVSIRDAADMLGIEPWVLARLCRYLHVNARDQRIPVHVLERAKLQSQTDDRYATLRSWLLQHYISAHDGRSVTAGERDRSA